MWVWEWGWEVTEGGGEGSLGVRGFGWEGKGKEEGELVGTWRIGCMVLSLASLAI